MKGLIALAAAGLLVAACSTDADVANENIKKAAEQFEITRRVTGINGITDQVFLEAVGRCSFEAEPDYYDVICRTSEGEFLRHVMSRSDNAVFIVEQLEPAEASTAQYRFVVKPSALIPDIDVE